MNLFGKFYSREEILKHFGDISQFAGICRIIFDDGKAKGVNAYEVRTGSGFIFTILNDRCLDIGLVEHQGRPISFMSKTGICAPSFFNPEGHEWLRSFGGGLLTTCGLANVGPPEQNGIWQLGMHGRIANTPAEELCGRAIWQDDDLIFELEGKMREGVLYGENLLLHRRIQALAGEDRLTIIDKVTNNGFATTPLMLLYHINFGYPLISTNSKLYLPVESTVAQDPGSQVGIHQYGSFEEPSLAAITQVFYHKATAYQNGQVSLAVINKKMNYGFYVQYHLDSLPYLTEWKNMQYQDYVFGIEPGTCLPIGRAASISNDKIRYIRPQESLSFEIELGVLPTKKAISRFIDLRSEYFHILK